MPQPLIDKTTLETLIRQAGEIALSYFNDLKNINVDKKSPRDFVTAADIAVENFLKEKLGELYPEYGFGVKKMVKVQIKIRVGL